MRLNLGLWYLNIHFRLARKVALAQRFPPGLDRDKWYPKLAGKVPFRVMLAVYRAYSQRVVTKPINRLSDEELLSIGGIGQKGLAEIRRALTSDENARKGAVTRRGGNIV